MILRLLKKLLSWGEFKVNIGKGNPGRPLPTTPSDIQEQEISSIEDLKRILSGGRK